MAYFPNGTAGMIYEERWCYRCRNYRDKGDGRGFGCAIWDAHLLYSYEEALNTGEIDKGYKPLTNAKAMLDMFIPMDEDHFPAECSMFFEMPKEEVEARDAESDRKMQEEREKELPATLRPNRGPKVMPAMAEWAKARGLVEA